MGIIQRQTIKSSIYIYLGVIIGFINVSVLYPKFLTPSQIGVLTLLVSWGSLFSQFATLGFGGATIRYFPYFRNKEKKHQGFFFLTTMVFLLGIGVVLLLYYTLKDWIVQEAGDESLLSDYIQLLVPITVFMLMFMMLDIYNRALYNATTGTLLNETVSRIFVLILLYPYIVDLISFEAYTNLYVVTRGLLAVLLLLFLFWKRDISLKPDFSLLDKEMRQGILSLSFFSFLAGFTAIAVMRIDAIMIGSFMSEADVGIYITTFYYGTLISLPSRALRGIAPTLVSDAFKEGKLDVVADIYRKSSITQMVAGCFFMIGLWANIDNVFKILPEEFLPGKYVILYIGLMNLVKMFTGNNDMIIGYSKYYRFNTYSLLGWLLLIVLTNWLLIPVLGLDGAALASLISVIVVSLVRVWFIYHKFGFQPFDKNHFIILLISLLTYMGALLLPEIEPFVLDILLRGSLVTLLFVPAIYFSGTAPEINQLIDTYLKYLPGLGKKD